MRRLTRRTAPVHLVSSSPTNPQKSARLRRRLVITDIVALVVAWVLAGALPFYSVPVLPSALLAAVAICALVFVSLCVIGLERLYLARVCVIRAEEKVRLLRASFVTSGFGLLVTAWATGHFYWAFYVVGAAATFSTVGLGRLGYHHWLRVARTNGRFMRPVLVIGSNTEAEDLIELLQTHPEVGMRVVGVLGNRNATTSIDAPWSGEVGEFKNAIDRTEATGAVLVASAIEPQMLRHIMQRMLQDGIHVHVSSGLTGLDYRRVRSQPLSHEPLFYVEPWELGAWQLVVKRAVDIVLGSLFLVLASPVILVAAVLIKLRDGGPIFFHQTRIGLDGKPFTFLKLRSMRVAAEHNEVLADENQRDGGPLFKSDVDPRRTGIGRLLEATSIDELPQLFNVLRGDMSLIGPRPALPHEVAQFDEALMARHRMRPGITGLWQVEGRDNPSFNAYRRLDLFYVENWSLLLDMTVLFSTVQVVITRAACKLFNKLRPHREVAPVIDLVAEESAS